MLRILFCCTLLGLGTACQPASEPAAGSPTAAAEPAAIVYASNYPLAYFAERLAGSLAELRFPASSTGDPAYWEPTPDDVQAMQKADLILLNGATYESWTRGISLPASRTVVTTRGMEDQLIEVEEAVTHSHGDEGEHSHAGTAFTTWLDLSMAAAQAAAVRDGLLQALPEHQALINDRHAALEADLLQLDEAWRDLLEDKKLRVVYAHPVFQYFQRRYGVVGSSLHWEPGELPTEDMLHDLRHELDHHPVQWMVWEGEPSPEAVAALRDMGLSSAVLDPCARRPNTGDFLSVMEANTEALRRLAGAVQ